MSSVHASPTSRIEFLVHQPINAFQRGTERQHYRQRLLSAIYTPFLDRMTEELDRIIDANTRVGPWSYLFFSYLGVFYPNNQDLQHRVSDLKIHVEMLHPSLHASMNRYLLAFAETEAALPQINMYLSAVLSRGSTLEDFQRCVPECIRSAVETPMRIHSDKPPLTDQQCSYLRAQYSEQILLIKQQFVINMIS